MSLIIHIPTKDRALVRTGFGKASVFTDRLCITIPGLHSLTPVNLQMFPVVVKRQGRDSLKAKDVHVNIHAIFNLKVDNAEGTILKAVEHFGKNTFNLQGSEIIHSQLEGALREAAAKMNLDELQEKRADFVNAVTESLSKHLADSGLLLHSVSIQVLTQTDPKDLDDTDIFGARTRAFTAAEVQKKRTEENAAVRDNEVAIATKNVETQKKMFDLELAQENKRIDIEKQKIEFESQRLISIAIAQANQEKKSQEAAIDKDIAIQMKRKQELEAKETTFKALQNANEAETAAETVRARAVAMRDKEIGIINTEREMESQKLRIVKQAEAQKESIVTLADADLEKTRKQAEAILALADAKQRDYEVEATGKTKLNEAENKLSVEIIQMKLKQATIENAAAIIRELVNPINSVDSINIVHAPGLIGGNSGSSGSGSSNDSFPNQVVTAALKHRYSAAFADKLLNNIGLDLSNPAKIMDTVCSDAQDASGTSEEF